MRVCQFLDSTSFTAFLVGAIIFFMLFLVVKAQLFTVQKSLSSPHDERQGHFEVRMLQAMEHLEKEVQQEKEHLQTVMNQVQEIFDQLAAQKQKLQHFFEETQEHFTRSSFLKESPPPESSAEH